jgi:hypothetical protein
VAIHFDATAPSAAPGDMWWTGGKLALAIDDLTSIQWVQISAMNDTSVPGPWDFPDAPAIGEQFTPSGSSVALTWDGNIWTFPMGGVAGTITIADDPPTGVAPNTLWWDSNSGDLFVNYNDADSTQWVQINRNAPATTGITEAPTDGQQYARQSSAWSVVAAAGGGAFLPLDGSAPMTGLLTANGGITVADQSFAHGAFHWETDVTWGNLTLLGNPFENILTANLTTRAVDFFTTPTVLSVPIAMGSELQAANERIARLEERLARLEAR